LLSPEDTAYTRIKKLWGEGVMDEKSQKGNKQPSSPFNEKERMDCQGQLPTKTVLWRRREQVPDWDDKKKGLTKM